MQTGMVKAMSARKGNAVFKRENRKDAMTLTPPFSRKAGRSLPAYPKLGQRSNGIGLEIAKNSQDKTNDK
jgi:hypothetical protein